MAKLSLEAAQSKKPSIEAEQGAQKWNADGVTVENRIAALAVAAYAKVEACY